MSLTLDTRFFLTHFLADTKDLREKTETKMKDAERTAAIVPTIVVHEVYKFEFQNLGKEVADLRVHSILTANFRVVDLNTSIALKAARLRCKYAGLPTADTIIAATAVEHNAIRILTDDPHFKQIREIKMEWI